MTTRRNANTSAEEQGVVGRNTTSQREAAQTALQGHTLRRDNVFGQIKRLAEFVTSEEFANASIPFLQAKLHVLGTYWDTLSNEHMAIISFPTTEESSNHHTRQYLDGEKYFTEAIAAMNQRILEMPAVGHNIADNRQTSLGVRYEPITLNEFTGDHREWGEWRAVYESLYHNNPKLENAHKFQYLKRALKGKAAGLLAGWQALGENYEEAYKLLVDAYENRYLKTMAHLDSLFSLKPCERETHESIRALIDGVNGAIRQLRVAGSPVDHWDNIVTHILITRMPQRTLNAWESTNELNDMPPIAEVITFLEKRARAALNLEINSNSSVKNSTNNSNQRASNQSYNKTEKASVSQFNNRSSSNAAAMQCHHCKGNHSLFKCDKFKALAVKHRSDRIKALGLCFGCFKGTHKSNSGDCSQRVCPRCPNTKHNSLLCPRLTQSLTVATIQTQSEPTTGEQSGSQNFQ